MTCYEVQPICYLFDVREKEIMGYFEHVNACEANPKTWFFRMQGGRQQGGRQNTTESQLAFSE